MNNRCRIINGFLKRRFISSPGISSTRPTSDIVKQAMFNILVHRFSCDFEKALVIDLFAGSGSLGIESISHGCRKALFVDSNIHAIKCIHKNVIDLGVESYVKVINQKAENLSNSFFLKETEGYNEIIIFMDPPYSEKQKLLDQIERFRALFKNKRLIIVAESDEKLECFPNINVSKHGIKYINILY